MLGVFYSMTLLSLDSSVSLVLSHKWDSLGLVRIKNKKSRILPHPLCVNTIFKGLPRVWSTWCLNGILLVTSYLNHIVRYSFLIQTEGSNHPTNFYWPSRHCTDSQRGLYRASRNNFIAEMRICIHWGGKWLAPASKSLIIYTFIHSCSSAVVFSICNLIRPGYVRTYNYNVRPLQYLPAERTRSEIRKWNNISKNGNHPPSR